MASSSSSTVISSSGAGDACVYDVFISFRGEDTQHNFTDPLYDRLQLEGIYPFRDDEEINRDEELAPQIKRAIKKSKVSIVVLSKNYATSAWCLDELLLILSQRRECNHFVLPIFYGVQPRDIKNQRGSFAIQVKPSSTRWTDHNVNLWTTALMEVANLSGEVVYGHETSILKKIIVTIHNKLGAKDVRLPLNVIGMVTRYEDIKSWLDQCNNEFLTICGMGGSGKTTLAKYIYKSNRKSFEYVSFVEAIGRRCEKPNGLLEVQEQLLKDITLGGKERKISRVFNGKHMIEEALRMKRALIVLDDIDAHSQLFDLLKTREINAQSKIIITTREITDNWPDIPCWRYKKYEMRLLNDNESSQLLCHHAFRSEYPNAGLHEVVQRVVQYCKGNPLALEVLGSLMFKNDAIRYWESDLSLFERNTNSQIRDVLIESYRSLPGTVKDLFLHIACFFNGIDVDYVVKILEPDYSAISGIKTLINRCLLSVSPNKKLTMHRLVQEMGKNIVAQESKIPEKRSRVWLSRDSYKILRNGEGSKQIEGLALDFKMLVNENFKFKSARLQTDALKNMDKLKLLQLNFVELDGSYENFSEDLKWLCWQGFHLRTIPSNLYMGNLVAIDMSYSNLEVFEPPMVIMSLKILNLKDSHNLLEIRSITRIPNLETLILLNCYNLVTFCVTLGDLTKLALLNMTGCRNLCSLGHTKKSIFSLPISLQQLFLKECHLACTDSFPLSFIIQPRLQYVNLDNSGFESLPCCDHLENLRILDLSFCSKINCLISLPSTLTELYIYYCELLERITFQSHQFTLQEFGYEGCINLYEIEGFIKLVPISKLDETDLRHMKWLKEYQNHQVCLVGDELTVGRNWQIQMLSEFGIMSTSLPDIKDPRLIPKYLSISNSLFFDVPSCPKNKKLIGINVTFKYSITGDDWAWFCKISTTNGVVDWMYNPKVFGKPEDGEVCIWLSYWPIGNKLNTGDTVGVSIVEISGLEVHECGVSLVYSDQEILEYNLGWAEILGGDLSRFQLSTGASYLCRRDFIKLMDVGRLTSDWFRKLVGDAVDHTEVRGWGMTGRPKPVSRLFTELKTIDGPQLDQKESEGLTKAFGPDESKGLTSPTHMERLKSVVTDELSGQDIKKISGQTKRHKMIKPLSALQGIESTDYEENEGKLAVIGAVDPETLTSHARKSPDINFSGEGPSSERLAKQQERILSRTMNSQTGEGDTSSSTSAHPCRRFSLAEIQSAAKNFSAELVIGRGGFGAVYKGQISDEKSCHVVAIKRLNSMSDQGEVEFRAEIDTLCKLRHCHLVPLIGFCDDTKEKVLVYEYMPNGTLYDHLHKARTPLSWITRLKIAIGAARGMDYLHTGVGTRYGVIHRDLKSTNILLDANLEAMVSDFGMSIISPTNQSISGIDASFKGTFGYLDPVYYYTRKLTRKTDVYAFGVVLFELLSGRLAVDLDREEDECSLVRWAEKCVKERKFDQMVDPTIKGTISSRCLRQFAKLAACCVQDVLKERPTMGELVTSLQALLEQQEKSNRSSQSLSKIGFPWKIHKYFVPTTKPNSDESGTSS